MSKPMLMYISHGHGQDNDPGAVSGKFEEREMAVKVAKAWIQGKMIFAIKRIK